jgi:signal transduction histidine kinase
VPTTGALTAFTTHDGLPGSAVYSVLEDGRGRLWLGTNQGLSCFDRHLPAAQRFRNYTVSDGLGSTEFNRHAAVLRADGSMVFGGMNGLTLFHPDRVRDNPYVPPVHLTRIEVASRDGVRGLQPEAVSELQLWPRDKTFGFEFAALNYTAPERNRYAYRLDGFDADWVHAGTRRSCQYTNIPPGSYVFRVKGSNNDGVWNEQGASLPVVVHPAFWQTWWFRALVAAIVAALVWAGYRYRALRRLEMQRLRLRIAGDLHDDVSSDLSGIAMVADMVQGKTYLEEAERRDLVEVRDTALNMVDGVRDIVWYIDPEHDSLESMVIRMRTVAATLLRGIGFDLVTDLPGRSIAVPMAVRRDLYLIFKEALHNVVRHAGAERVVIELAIAGGRLRLRISDDGCGFDVETAKGGHGLRSMRRRAAEIGAELHLDSVKGSGTELRLEVDLARSRDGGRGSRGRILKGRRTPASGGRQR